MCLRYIALCPDINFQTFSDIGEDQISYLHLIFHVFRFIAFVAVK